ncbi:MAG: sensor histidine kinase [Ignavibacteriaceae bacterium]|nr:sensor histidine kinase [Ignavibacteriaceae bacterium]
MIRSLIQNLISNAIKLTHNGGNINISCSKMNNDDVEIQVIDTGVGMSEDKISKLFRIDENISSP